MQSNAARKIEPSRVFKIALICSDAAVAQSFKEQINAVGFSEIVHLNSVEEFHKLFASDHDCAGAVVELRTKMRASADDKVFMFRLLDCMPVVEARYNQATKEISGAFDGHLLSGNDLFKDFKRSVETFTPRPMRKHERKSIYLSVMCHVERNGQTTSLRCVTGNLSAGGCFIISGEDLAVGETVRVQFSDPSAGTQTVSTIVCWTRPWGKTSAQLPGFGVAFRDMNKEFSKRLNELTRKVNLLEDFEKHEV